jgi:transcription-repair coupling factor (superfamily II helicase)
LLSPPLECVTPEARRRLKAIEEYSELGSGVNIALQDLDIRGAGNILGSEQSGFISDIGYETYTKILAEAIDELKETEFSELFKDETPNNAKKLIKSTYDCNVETDLDVFIPDYYISNTTERIKIYKEIDSSSTTYELDNLKSNLKDRFGKIPKETENLFKIAELKQIAGIFLFHKIIFKNNHFIGFFPHNNPKFYNSGVFSSVLSLIQATEAQRVCEIKMKDDELSLRIFKAVNVDYVIGVLKGIFEGD